ncbi:MAG TPA: glycosyltransferase family 4 protein [Paenibacillus sp.]|uniref:glycosyltransferase family 4 protein n=1 Tax=Paenibacillus sp. TaxID=58172 RepID=UPI0028D8AC36|nr:glycosyltransferase family 4 protein [Paenibacillus sp.]HUC91106.1 glycosyltransferase family 4 protein [Paenibacillus sp.]
MNKKSVLIINSGSLPMPPVDGGAIQQVLHQIAMGLSLRGWKVGVLTITNQESEEAQLQEEARSVKWYKIKGRLQSGGISGIFSAQKILRQSLASIPPNEYENVIIYDPYLAGTVNRWSSGTNIIWSVHNVRNRTSLLVKIWSRHISKVVSISRFLKETIDPTLSKRSTVIHVVIHNPLSEKWLNEQPIEFKKANSILFCGRLIPEKGLDVLVKAINLLSERQRKTVKLGIAGSTHFKGASESEYSTHVRDLLEKSDINYKFLGFIDHKELHNVYDAYQILVIPSNWAEPATLVAGEGQARDCIVISSTAGGLPEMVSPTWHPYLVPPGDAERLTEVLSKVIDFNHEGYSEEVKLWLKKEFHIQHIVTQWERLLIL